MLVQEAVGAGIPIQHSIIAWPIFVNERNISMSTHCVLQLDSFDDGKESNDTIVTTRLVEKL
jgi:hypothetical protein